MDSAWLVSHAFFVSLIPDYMQAVVYRGVNDLRVETVPVPEISPEDLLIHVEACGICPTDLKKITGGTVPPPRIFGHETAGTIVKTGEQVQRFQPGDRVALHHHVPCLNCHACRHSNFAQCPQYKRTGITAGFEPAGGGFAEFVRVMPFVLPGVVPIPPRNTFEEGAMIEPVNTVLKAVRRLSLLEGDRVLVVGQGPIGLMFSRLLVLEGIQVTASDLLPERLELARQFGVAACWVGDINASPSEQEAWKGFDAVVLTVPGQEMVAAAFQRVRAGGEILLFAHTVKGKVGNVDFASICVDEITLLGSYSADYGLQGEAAEVIFSRKMDVRPLITHRFPLAQANEAVQLVRSPAAGSLKVIIGQGGGGLVPATKAEKQRQKIGNGVQKIIDSENPF